MIRGGLVARLTDAGLCGSASQAPELARVHARAGLASLALVVMLHADGGNHAHALAEPPVADLPG